MLERNIYAKTADQAVDVDEVKKIKKGFFLSLDMLPFQNWRISNRPRKKDAEQNKMTPS